MKTLNATRHCSLVKLSDVEHAGPPLGEQLINSVRASATLILDVDGVQFNSMMLGELVNVLGMLKAKWGESNAAMALVRPTAMARQVMQVSKLDQAIPLFDDLDSAWRGVGSRGSH
jgi:anti-anti-sigma regulatory factor